MLRRKKQKVMCPRHIYSFFFFLTPDGVPWEVDPFAVTTSDVFLARRLLLAVGPDVDLIPRPDDFGFSGQGLQDGGKIVV